MSWWKRDEWLRLLIGWWIVGQCISFTTPLSKHNRMMIATSSSNFGLVQHHPYRSSRDGKVRMNLFRELFRRDKPEDSNDDNEDKEGGRKEDVNGKVEMEKDSSSKGILPFFAKRKEEDESSSPVAATIVKDKKELAIENAKLLKAQAERARLEAEKLDVILTLDKITKLEKELNSRSVENNPTRQKDIQNQIDILSKKLNGEEPTTTTKSTTENDEAMNEDPAEATTTVLSDGEKIMSDNGIAEEEKTTEILTKKKGLDQEELEARVDKFNKTPTFMQKIIAQTADMDLNDDHFNVTSLVLKLYEDEQEFLQELGSDNGEMPKFTDEQIQEKVNQLKNVPQFVKNLYGEDAQNDTAIALSMLETDWKEQQLFSKSSNKQDTKDNKNTFDTLLKQFGDEEVSEQNRMIESLFPDSTRKEDVEITEAQIKVVVADLAKVWQSSAQPLKISGGYIIRGTPKGKYENSNGDELIDAIDSCMARSAMKGQVSIFYIYDPTPITEDQMNGMTERPPVLLVMGPDVAREPQFIARTAITGIALGTTWYASIYPFLMNDKILKAAEEQIALADASMPSDLTWLTDSSIPLFGAFLGILLAHELGHRAIASINNVKVMNIPTLVPSLITGVTNSITSLKEPPKNRQALLDFAVAGPLTGIAFSLAVLYYGLIATASMDAASYANLPAMPIEFLRQSSLGGGIVEAVLGAGTLDVPDAAAGTAAVANLNIPLHPFAIAGYLGLLVNAISLWPVGRTDGGRIAMTLFGRTGTQLVAFLALVFLFIGGIANSDLFLFYFSYVVFFQGELEIPQRNEVDEVDFSRVILVTATGVLTLLTLIPM